MRKYALPVVAAGVLWALAPVSASYAQDARVKSEIEALRAQVKELEQRIDQLEPLGQQVKIIDRRLELQQQDLRTQPKELARLVASSQGFWIASPDGAFKLRIGGYIQGVGSFFTSGGDKPATGSTFFLRRVRPFLQGTVFRYFDYKIMPDFAQGKTVLEEAYMNVHYLRQFQLMAGKFKSPFGIERLQSAADLEWVERGLTNNLIPNRDIGLMFHGEHYDGRVSWQLAFLNGVPDDTASADADSNDGKDLVGRIFLLPFKDTSVEFARGLGIGFAGSFGDQRGALSVYKTAGQQTFFSYAKNATASGARYRVSPQAYYYNGPFGLLADFVNDTQRVNFAGTMGSGSAAKSVNKTATFANHAWQVQTSYLLTGENATYYRVKPFHNFDPASGHWGALEIKARAGGLAADSDVFKDGFASTLSSARTATEWGAGFNWYLNPNFKLRVDYVRTLFDKGAAGGKDRRDESGMLTEMQLVF